MNTTSVKLPNELKERVASAAQRSGLSAHAYMVDAIRQTVAAAERRAAFMDEAEVARKQARRANQGISADEVHDYIRDKSRGKTSTRPRARSWCA
jgi:predicted transcriptional regulator